MQQFLQATFQAVPVLVFLFGPYQKDRRGQDRQHHLGIQDAKAQQQQRPKPRARDPSAATWPETQRAAQQQAPDQARGAQAHVHGAHGALEVQTPRSYISSPASARVGALLVEICAQKN